MKKIIQNEIVVFVCETPTHGDHAPQGIAEKMFSVSPKWSPLPRREEDVRVACYGCRKAAEKAGLQVFPLHVTLRKIAERAAARMTERQETEKYFRSLGAKAGGGLLAAREQGRQEALQEQLPPRGQSRKQAARERRGDWRQDVEAARTRGARKAVALAAAKNGDGGEEEE